MATQIYIEPKMLTWAVARAGHDLHDFAATYPRILDWLEHKKRPTVKQLEDFSKKVYIPFGYLLLPEPPKEKLPIPFFRSNSKVANGVNINVFDTIMLLKQRQNWLSDFLQDNETPPLAFVGKFRNNFNQDQIVADLRHTLGLDEVWAARFHNTEATLNFLTEKVEELGIIPMFSSVVENNNTRPIKVEDCRGFVLIDAYAPFMFINAADSKSAQLFTMIHELAHVWVGQSAGFDFRQLQPANDPIEQLCDSVAAEFLVPQQVFLRLWREKGNVFEIAKYFKVSPIVAARRALDLGKISRKMFIDFYDNYVRDLEIKKAKQTSGGGDFFSTQKKRLSLAFTAHIYQAVKADKLLYRDAYKLTGLKGDTFQGFYDKYFGI